MINIFPFKSLGNHDYGWLNARYHFNFANYFQLNKGGYPPLIVWNDDQIQPGTGFPMHSHKNMEIITYVRKGAISHEDSLGNRGVTRAGEIQIMSAGSGITHSERNDEKVETSLFQIWLQPNVINVEPRWETVTTILESETKMNVLATGQEENRSSDLLHIYQDATLYLIKGRKSESLDHVLDEQRQVYFVVSDGNLLLNNNKVEKRSGVFIYEEKLLHFNFLDNTEVVLLDLQKL